MKQMLILLLLITVMTIGAQVFAANGQPVMSNNVTVLQNITSPAQCPANYSGTGQPTNIMGTTPVGPASGTAGQVTQQCSGCYFQKATRSCICRTCYGANY